MLRRGIGDVQYYTTPSAEQQAILASEGIKWSVVTPPSNYTVNAAGEVTNTGYGQQTYVPPPPKPVLLPTVAGSDTTAINANNAAMDAWDQQVRQWLATGSYQGAGSGATSTSPSGTAPSSPTINTSTGSSTPAGSTPAVIPKTVTDAVNQIQEIAQQSSVARIPNWMLAAGVLVALLVLKGKG